MQRLLGGAVPADRGARAADGGCAPCARKAGRPPAGNPGPAQGSAVGTTRLAPAARYAARAEVTPTAAWIRAFDSRRGLGTSRPAHLRPSTLNLATTHALP